MAALMFDNRNSAEIVYRLPAIIIVHFCRRNLIPSSKESANCSLLRDLNGFPLTYRFPYTI